jgi:hypothetical protein
MVRSIRSAQAEEKTAFSTPQTVLRAGFFERTALMRLFSTKTQARMYNIY